MDEILTTLEEKAAIYGFRDHANERTEESIADEVLGKMREYKETHNNECVVKAAAWLYLLYERWDLGSKQNREGGGTDSERARS